MKKIIIKDNYAFILAPSIDDEDDLCLYYQPIDNHNMINVALDDEYAWRAEYDGGSWIECDARMGYDLDELKKELSK
jgi:hypothetical protein